MNVDDASDVSSLGRRLLGVLLLVALAIAAVKFDLAGLCEQTWIAQQGQARSLAGGLQLAALMALATAVGMPRQLVAFGAGYVYGAALGTLVSTLAVTAGAVVSYFAARRLFAAQIDRTLLSRWPAVGQFLREDTFSKTVAVRYFPVGNNLVTNLIAGSSGAPPLPFFAGSLIGYLPQMLVFALTGSGVAVASETRIAIGIVLFCIATWLSLRMYRRSRARRVLEAAQ